MYDNNANYLSICGMLSNPFQSLATLLVIYWPVNRSSFSALDAFLISSHNFPILEIFRSWKYLRLVRGEISRVFPHLSQSLFWPKHGFQIEKMIGMSYTFFNPYDETPATISFKNKIRRESEERVIRSNVTG